MSEVFDDGPLDPGAPRRRRWWLRILLAIVPAVGFMALLSVAVFRSGTQAEAGKSAPSFELALLDGSGVLTDEDLEGRPVVINFWASWCIPCREEAPLFEKAWKAYRDEGVIVLGVNIKDAESDARAFVKELGLTYPVVRDLNQDLTKNFGVRGLPETFFVDHRWTFIGAISGERSDEQQGTVILGAVSEDELVSNIELLLRRMASADQGDDQQ